MCLRSKNGVGEATHVTRAYSLQAQRPSQTRAKVGVIGVGCAGTLKGLSLWVMMQLNLGLCTCWEAVSPQGLFLGAHHLSMEVLARVNLSASSLDPSRWGPSGAASAITQVDAGGHLPNIKSSQMGGAFW